MTVRGKPSLDRFIEAGDKATKTTSTVSKKSQAGASVEPPKRTKKIFELPETIIADLEQRCVDERRQLGRRVTQTEIVERALETYLYGKR